MNSLELTEAICVTSGIGVAVILVVFALASVVIWVRRISDN
jgi:hypothetical protein